VRTPAAPGRQQRDPGQRRRGGQPLAVDHLTVLIAGSDGTMIERGLQTAARVACEFGVNVGRR
jgi:hypothetical protein